MKYYYTDQDSLYYYTAQLPDIMTLPSGEKQLVINRLESNETYAEIINLNGNIKLENITQQALFGSLCENLIFTPTECLLYNLTQENQTVTDSDGNFVGTSNNLPN